MINQSANQARAEDTAWLTQMVLELCLEAGANGIKARTIAQRLGITFGVNRHALLRLEKQGLIERSRRKGNDLYWGPPGVAARRKEIRDLEVAEYNKGRMMAKREQRALERSARVHQDVDMLPIRRLVVPACQAPKLVKPCAASVWELAA